MNIYKFTFFGESDWIFAPNIKEAKKFYINHINSADLEGCEIKKVPKSEWKNSYLLDPNETEPDEDDEIEYNEDDYSCGLKIIMTFEEYAAQNTQTDIIATTDY